MFARRPAPLANIQVFLRSLSPIANALPLKDVLVFYRQSMTFVEFKLAKGGS